MSMDLSSAVTMDAQDAAEAITRYAALPPEQRTETDRATVEGLRELAAGKTLIDVRAALMAGGTDDLGHPRLAVGRADWEWCHLRQDGPDVEFLPARWVNGHTRTLWYSEAFPDQPRGRYENGSWVRGVTANAGVRAMVPPIPPHVRPKRYRLRKFLILWEVPAWEKAPRPPGDPALLRPLSGNLCTVEHVWDLTDLERLVLAARSHEPS